LAARLDIHAAGASIVIMVRVLFLALCLPALLLQSCSKAQEATSAGSTTVAAAVAPFDFAAPVSVLPLPKSLREISGLIALDGERVACIQDEKGQFFEVRLNDGVLLTKVRFGPDGDYEGLARVPGAWFAVRSDGVLLRMREVDGSLQAAEAFVLALPQRDCEALCVDRDGTRLLVAGKAQPEGGAAEQDRRFVYAWDLATAQLVSEPALQLSVEAILAAAVARGLTTPTKASKSSQGVPVAGPSDDPEVAALATAPPPRAHLALRITELAVNPSTGDVWILSAQDRVLLAVDRRGALVWLHTFAEALLPQPEALAFLPDGDLLVASEGRDGPAVLVRFAARRLPGASSK
jgi:hypothetical protein